MQYKIINLKDNPTLISEASQWFSSKWRVPIEAYRKSMEASLQDGVSVPMWYLCLNGSEIIGGMGVIENDFHPRKDLTPNVCAVFTEEAYRNRGIAGEMLSFVCEDMAKNGIETLYLLTDHTSFYERYGWEYLCPVTGDGEETPSRMYIHKHKAFRLETNRLYLRELKESDYDDLYAVFADSDIMKHYPYTFDEKRVKNWIVRNKERYRVFGFGLWALCLKETDKMIGDCGLTMQNINGFIRPEIGYHIRKEYQHNGYAKEAATAVRDWCFENTAFQAVYSYMKKENIPSQATARSYGCVKVDEYRDEDGDIAVVYCISKNGLKYR